MDVRLKTVKEVLQKRDIKKKKIEPPIVLSDGNLTSVVVRMRIPPVGSMYLNTVGGAFGKGHRTFRCGLTGGST